MKEYIFQILCMSSESMVNVPSKVKRSMAKEITGHVIEFIQWLMLDEEDWYYDVNTKEWLERGKASELINPRNAEQIYKYWLNNVKNK